MVQTIVKATSKGQITLPVAWRRNFSTNQFMVELSEDSLKVRPIDLEKIASANEYTVFDAIRDNEGKGIYAKDLQKILRSIK